MGASVLIPRIDAGRIEADLDAAAGRADRVHVGELLAKARELKGLTQQDVAVLLQAADPDLDAELFHTARAVKEAIYGNRLVLFAPLYITNRCQNDCLYCAFRASNRDLVRRDLSYAEIEHETRMILREGHKRILLVAGEHYPGGQGLDYVYEAIARIYGVTENGDRIRRLNVNVAALDVAHFRRLKQCGIGTYQLFQETYHRPTYAVMHPRGPKSDYDNHLGALDRAMTAGIDDCGTGVLFGLYDHRFEVLALMEHAAHLEREFGVGPHTISVPRIEPAAGSEVADHPPFAVSDREFLRLVAILRLAVPYTGIILSTREGPDVRRQCLEVGVSQISASSRTNPGGYAEAATGDHTGEQFSLGDHRSLDEVIADVMGHGFIPSFCTACYRKGRTGRDFMDLAKPGLIKEFCQPNAILTLQEYLEDHASAATRDQGARLIADSVSALEREGLRCQVCDRLVRIADGERDLYL